MFTNTSDRCENRISRRRAWVHQLLPRWLTCDEHSYWRESADLNLWRSHNNINIVAVSKSQTNKCAVPANGPRNLFFLFHLDTLLRSYAMQIKLHVGHTPYSLRKLEEHSHRRPRRREPSSKIRRPSLCAFLGVSAAARLTQHRVSSTVFWAVKFSVEEMSPRRCPRRPNPSISCAPAIVQNKYCKSVQDITRKKVNANNCLTGMT